MRNLLISMVANFLFWWTKQIFFLVIKLEPLLLSWLQPRKSNCVPTELDVSISAIDISLKNIELSLNYIGNLILKIRVSTLINIDLALIIRVS